MPFYENIQKIGTGARIILNSTYEVSTADDASLDGHLVIQEGDLLTKMNALKPLWHKDFSGA